MGLAQQTQEVQIGTTLSLEIYDQVKAKAEAMNLTVDQMVAVLLKLGLAAQERRESELDQLVQRHRDGDPSAGEALGEALFG